MAVNIFRMSCIWLSVSEDFIIVSYFQFDAAVVFGGYLQRTRISIKFSTTNREIMEKKIDQHF